MEKTIYILAISTFIGGTSLIGCKSNTEEKENAIENVNEANKELKEVEANQTADQLTKANDEEWQAYKAESNKTIMANDNRIEALRKAMNKLGTTFDGSYEKSIDALEDKNKALENRIINYENNQTDWESFKREFNADVNSLASSLKDVSTNKK